MTRLSCRSQSNRRWRAGAGVAVVMLTLGAPSAWAQLIQGPPGSVRGVFGGQETAGLARSSQRWVFTADASAGRDSGQLLVGAVDPRLALTGAAATVAAQTQYRRGGTERYLETSGGGVLNRHNVATDQLRGVSGDLRVGTRLGARSGLQGRLSADYQPLVVANLVTEASTVLPNPALPAPTTPVGPPTGVLEERWLATMGAASVYRSLTPRQRLEVGFTRWQWRPIGGSGFEARTHSVSAQESWRLTERVMFQVMYRFDENRQFGVPGLDGSTRTHIPELGFRLERRLAPTRTVSVGVQGGAAHSSFNTGVSGDLTSFVPVGSGTLQMNFSGRWSLAANARRHVGMLSGVSTQAFKTDQASVQLEGRLAPRVVVAGSGALSRGRTSTLERGSFEAANATARLQVGLSRWLGAFTSYSYYRHRLLQLDAVAVGLPDGYGRHAARIGVTVWLPLYGAF